MDQRNGRAARPRVLVTGGEYPAGLAALRALDRAGFETWAAVPSRDCLAARSRCAAGLVDVPDPRTHPDGFVAVLAEAAERIGAAAVLPGSEAGLLAVAGREDDFPRSVAVGSAPETVLRRATDKIALGLLALRAGMDAPPTRIVDAANAGRDGDVTFPAMAKPLRSELLAGGHLQRFEAKRVESLRELKQALAEYPDGVGLVQPYIDGRLISVNGVSFEGRLHAANQHVVYRVWPDRCGQASYCETIPLPPERERALARFMEELDWSGVFNLQLIEHGGRDYVIDLNPRFYVSLTLAVAAGLNLPAIWASLLLGLPAKTDGYRAGVRFRQEKGDPRAILSQLRRGQLDAATGLIPRRHTVHALFSIRDPRPGLNIVTDALGKLRRNGHDEPAAPLEPVPQDPPRQRRFAREEPVAPEPTRLAGRH
jgi:predicted ATP-grasp superfamily ATP-dependent carboligase